ALAAERPITDVTATPAASTEHALAKRLRIGDSFLFLEFAIPTATFRRLGRSSQYRVTAGDETATMLAKVALCYPALPVSSCTLPRVSPLRREVTRFRRGTKGTWRRTIRHRR